MVMLQDMAMPAKPAGPRSGGRDRVGAGEITSGGGGSDIAPLLRDGVPGLSERTVGTHYFDWHHSEADTLDKVNLEDFRKNMAAMAVMGYVLADMPGRLIAAPGGGRPGR